MYMHVLHCNFTFVGQNDENVMLRLTPILGNSHGCCKTRKHGFHGVIASITCLLQLHVMIRYQKVF